MALALLVVFISLFLMWFVDSTHYSHNRCSREVVWTRMTLCVYNWPTPCSFSWNDLVWNVFSQWSRFCFLHISILTHHTCPFLNWTSFSSLGILKTINDEAKFILMFQEPLGKRDYFLHLHVFSVVFVGKFWKYCSAAFAALSVLFLLMRMKKKGFREKECLSSKKHPG